MAKMVRITSAFPAQDTGKPMTYEFDLDVPEQAADYAATKKSWEAEGARYKASQRNVFRTKPGSPEEMQLGLLQERNLRDMNHDAPVGGAMAGEAVGGALGAPFGPWGTRIGATGGAWLGGAAGGAAAGENPIKSGNEMAAYSLAGRGAGRLLRGAGSKLMESALNPPAWINEAFPGTWRTALRERIGLANPRTLSEGLAETGIPGAERTGVSERLLGNQTGLTGQFAAGKKLDMAEQRVQQMLQKAQAVKPARLANGTMGQRGGRISLDKDVLPEVQRRLRVSGPLSRKPSGRIDAQVEVDRILTEVLNENPGAVDYVRAHQIKRGAQTEASDLLEQLQKARANGNLIDANAAIREQVMKELNAVLLDRLRAAVPGYRAAEARVTDLMGLERAMKFRAAQQGAGLDARAGVGGSIRIDPLGLFPEHLRSSVARNLDGPVAAMPQIGKYPVAYALSNLGKPKDEQQ